jgi:hypothetical protein
MGSSSSLSLSVGGEGFYTSIAIFFNIHSHAKTGESDGRWVGSFAKQSHLFPINDQRAGRRIFNK